jgi:hypothetical protein
LKGVRRELKGVAECRDCKRVVMGGEMRLSGEVLKDRRSPRERGRMGTSVR